MERAALLRKDQGDKLSMNKEAIEAEATKSILALAQMYKTLGSTAQHEDAALIANAIREHVTALVTAVRAEASAAKDAEIAALREAESQIDAALETWFYPGEFDSQVKAVQETARVWDGIVAALDIGDSDADVVKTIQDMVEYAGNLNEALAAKDAEIAALRELLKHSRRYIDEDDSKEAAAFLGSVRAALEMSGGVK